jgi:hypothetical protein
MPGMAKMHGLFWAVQNCWGLPKSKLSTTFWQKPITFNIPFIYGFQFATSQYGTRLAMDSCIVFTDLLRDRLEKN